MKYFLITTFIFCSLFSYADIIKDKEPGILEIQYTKTCVDDTLNGNVIPIP